ncbi:Com family DNA-binding transcriptional regulator [uncultured Clostridium sp.]|nr:Com family DNA-binding transcriptional regulator [uncultured Clostridium sp.]
MENVRCPNCNQLLLKAYYIKGEVKCPRCKKIIKLELNQKDRA